MPSCLLWAEMGLAGQWDRGWRVPQTSLAACLSLSPVAALVSLPSWGQLVGLQAPCWMDPDSKVVASPRPVHRLYVGKAMTRKVGGRSHCRQQ